MAAAGRLPAPVRRRLHAAAAGRDVSANLLITRAVTEVLDRLIPAQEALSPSAGTPELVVMEAEA